MSCLLFRKFRDESHSESTPDPPGVFQTTIAEMVFARGVLFDLDNTLLDRDRALEHWLGGLEMTSKQRDDVLLAACSGNHSRLIESLASLLEVDRAQAQRQLHNAIIGNTPPDPEVLRIVRAVADVVPCAVVTNGNSVAQRGKLAAAGLDDVFGERVFVSGELGSEKPDAKIFEAALESIGCEAGSAVFVGDDLNTDILGATRLSIQTVWLRRGRTFTSDQPTIAIDSLAELEGVLQLDPSGDEDKVAT